MFQILLGFILLMSLQPKSVIKFDTCAPPCWLGLQAGVNTRENVYKTLILHEGLFFNDSAIVGNLKDGRPIIDFFVNFESLLEGGSIGFHWIRGEAAGNRGGGSQITFDGDQVREMQITSNVRIYLRYIFQNFGQPDTIRSENSLYYDYLLLYYPDLGMIIEATADSVDKPCLIARALDTFELEVVSYLSPAAYQEQALEDAQTTGYVSETTWNTWLTDDTALECNPAIGTVND